MIRLLGELIDNSDNRFDLVLEVSKLAKQIKEETKELEGTTNPIIQALQEIAAQTDGTMLFSTGR